MKVLRFHLLLLRHLCFNGHADYPTLASEPESPLYLGTQNQPNFFFCFFNINIKLCIPALGCSVPTWLLVVRRGRRDADAKHAARVARPQRGVHGRVAHQVGLRVRVRGRLGVGGQLRHAGAQPVPGLPGADASGLNCHPLMVYAAATCRTRSKILGRSKPNMMAR